jgi:hypothetical protein
MSDEIRITEVLYGVVIGGSIQGISLEVTIKNAMLLFALGLLVADWNRARTLEERADRLANLQLLTGRENEAKQNTPFEERIESRDESFYDRHHIPTDPETHELENFETFLEQRSELIRSELRSVLGPLEDGPGPG